MKKKVIEEILQGEIKEPMDIPAKPEPVPDKIVLHLSKPIEVGINGVWYKGQDIEAKDIGTASEIVRIAREGYGSDILM